MRWLQALIALAPLLLLMACVAPRVAAVGTEPQPTLTTVDLCVQGKDSAIPLHAEVARSWNERRIGLMGRYSLGPFEGMLFLYEEKRGADAGFWMKGTLIPLDIAYLGRDGEILALNTMPPCAESTRRCPTYAPGVPYWAALETNAGFFAQHGISKGASVRERSPAQCRPAASTD